jgi:dihydrofolate reductase
MPMKTQYYTAASLDGYIATAQNSLDWLLQFEPVDGSSYPDFIREVGALAMGATTYEWLLAHEHYLDPATAAAWPYRQPVWVFSSRDLPLIPGADIRRARGDVRPVHAQMRAAAGDRNIWIVGGGELAGQFYDHGLLDELIVQVAAVTLGSGAPLLPRPIIDPPLRLRSAATFGEAFVELRYEVPPPQSRGA